MVGPAVRGKLLIVGVAADPIPVSSLALIFGGRSIHDSLTGSAIDNQDTLDFSVLRGILPNDRDGFRSRKLLRPTPA
jgi:propanol-preferring alcohol dehydrogenase